MVNDKEEVFDAIVVGGGLAGISAAYTMAEEGMEVLLLERGDYCGAKNVTGGRIYLNPIRDYFTDLWAKAPLERPITSERVGVMAGDRSITVEYNGQELAQEPYQSYSILRGKFDKWFAKQAERKGAAIITKSRVDDVIFENGRVVGVRAGGEELYARVVIACDGVLSFVAQKAGLKQVYNPHHYAVGVKEVIEVDRQVLEDRFNLQSNNGAACLYMGAVTAGKFGGGFLYTNQESVSLGLVVGINHLNQEPVIKAPDLFEQFKQRPEITRLIQGGQTVEYSAHVIPEGGLNMMGRLYSDGLLMAGDAAGFSMNIGVTVRGMEYAMASGYFAAKAAIQAIRNGDCSAQALSVYHSMLNESFVMKDFNSFKHSLNALENPRLFTFYPELAGSVMKELYAVPNGPKVNLYPTVKKHLNMGEIFRVIKDLRELVKL